MNARSDFSEALYNLEQKRYEEAVFFLDKAIEINKDSIQCAGTRLMYMLRSMAKYKINDKSWEQDFETTVSAREDYPPAQYFHLAEEKEKMGNIVGAEAERFIGEKLLERAGIIYIRIEDLVGKELK